MWGRAVERAIVAGHPCLVYSRRPRSVSDLLLDARRWGDREYLVQGARRLTRAGLAFSRRAVVEPRLHHADQRVGAISEHGT